jgi:hypothetical protein
MARNRFNFRKRLEQEFGENIAQQQSARELEQLANQVQAELEESERQRTATQKSLQAAARKQEVYRKWHALDLGKLAAAQETILEIPLETARFLSENNVRTNMTSYPVFAWRRPDLKGRTGPLWGELETWLDYEAPPPPKLQTEYDNSTHTASYAYVQRHKNGPHFTAISGWGINKYGDEFEIKGSTHTPNATLVETRYSRTEGGAWVTQSLDAPNVDIALYTLNEIEACKKILGITIQGTKRYANLDEYIATQLEIAAKPYIDLTQKLIS